jgi:hypothetical protein
MKYSNICKPSQQNILWVTYGHLPNLSVALGRRTHGFFAGPTSFCRLDWEKMSKKGEDQWGKSGNL